MKKIVVLFALVLAFCYSGKAFSLDGADWKRCADGVVNEQRQKGPDVFFQDMCAFYGRLPVENCAVYFSMLSEQEQERFVASYIVDGIVIPKCGMKPR